MPRACFFLLACCPVFAAGPSAADLARSIREATLDPDECYRVRDVRLQKEDIKVYLTDGYLIFSKPVAGERRSAVFTADVQGGDAEALLMPPTRGERQSLAMFTQSANLDQHFQAALMIFTDGSRELTDRITRDGSARKAPEMGALLAETWSPVMSNVQNGFQIRMIQDILAPDANGGMMFLAMSSRDAGNFDMVYDPRAEEQIVAGQLTERNGRAAYNVWASFPALSSRRGATKPLDPWYTVPAFQIDAAIHPDLSMKATTRERLRVGNRDLRVFGFEVSQAVEVESVKIDGAPAELFFQDSVRGRALRGSDDDVFLVVAPEPLAAGSEHEFEFAHQGSVIRAAGNNVFFVGARSNWFPRAAGGFATFDLTFHYPKRLTLVSTGDQVEDRTEGEVRSTRWKTPVPVRMAGFNLGDYEKVSVASGGFEVDVYGNRHLEVALEPKPVVPMVDLPKVRRYRMTQLNEPPPPLTPAPPVPDARLRAVAADVSAALDFCASKFGPPALKTLTVSPIPGTFGQGFPGLVYLSTVAYLDPSQRPAEMRDSTHQLFFSELLEAHEVAHQWWGSVVATTSYQDEWLNEALASYSALLFLEKRKGAKAMEQVLEGYRDHLSEKNEDGRTIESAGPITWGGRLDSSGIRDAWRAITYEKGAWIMHMLRRRMGDERFLSMLAELRRRYEFKSISTTDFRSLAREFVPPRTRPDVINAFFDNWVYATGIPALKLQYSVKQVAAGTRLTGTVTQTGVDDDFSADVPVEVQFATGATQTIWVSTSSDPTSFSATLKRAPVRVAIAPGGVLRTR
ncbi:MAG TPA: M1 family aminopeptidase [Bryobacteraceae bacterium]|nr:M1 family aminopeptidase [Bryobacteraceae bacterium]